MELSTKCWWLNVYKGVECMKNFYFEESGNYKITKNIDAENEEEAIERYEDWLHDEFYPGYINLEFNNRLIYEDIEW